MWFVLSSLWFMEAFGYGIAWILFILTISTGTWMTCSTRKPIPNSQKLTAAATPAVAPVTPGSNSKEQKTAKEPGSDGKKEDSVIFTPSQQAVIDAELKAALNAEKKDKEVKKAKEEKEKTEAAATTIKAVGGGDNGGGGGSMQKPISLGMTKADCLKEDNGKAAKTPASTSPKEELGKKIGGESTKDKKGEHHHAATAAGTDQKHEPRHGKSNEVKHEKGHDQKHEVKHATTPGAIGEPKHEKPPLALTPKAGDGPDGRSRYVGQAPNNLLVSAYVKPAGKK